MELAEIVMNPARQRIFQYLSDSFCPDISTAAKCPDITFTAHTPDNKCQEDDRWNQEKKILLIERPEF